MKIKRIVFVLLTVVAATSYVSASGPAFADREAAKLEGTWIVTVNISAEGFPSTFAALETYSRGGGLITTNDLPPVPRAGQGVWRISGSVHLATIVFFTFDSAGTRTGSIHVRHTISLEGKDEYTGTGEAEFFDLNGVSLVTLPFTTSARRLEDSQ